MVKHKSFYLAIIIACIVMGAAPSAFCALTAAATTTQQQIDSTSQEKKELENKLNQQQEDIQGLKGEKQTLQSELKNLNRQLTLVSEQLEDLENQIDTKEQEITDTEAALEEAIATQQWQYDCMVMRVRSMYERHDTDYVQAILNTGSFADMINMADWFESVAVYDKRKLKEFQENRALIEEMKEQLFDEKAQLDHLKVLAEAQKSKVSGLISQTSSSIGHYTNQISEAEQKALEYEAEIKKKEEDLEYLKKKLQEEMAMSQAAANAAWRDISEVSFEEGDRYLLANLIYCEAGGEPYAGQLAVGSVVINRVLSSKYPDSVVGVIYQKSQFSPVGSGRLDLALAANKATENCYKAADEAMSGATNVGNCVYFRTPIPGLEGINIGGHVFY